MFLSSELTFLGMMYFYVKTDLPTHQLTHIYCFLKGQEHEQKLGGLNTFKITRSDPILFQM